MTFIKCDLISESCLANIGEDTTKLRQHRDIRTIKSKMSVGNFITNASVLNTDATFFFLFFFIYICKVEKLLDKLHVSGNYIIS